MNEVRFSHSISSVGGKSGSLDNNSIQAGNQASLIGTINGVPVPVLEDATWVFSGNVQAVERIVYEPPFGYVEHPIQFGTYPLNTAFVFTVYRPVPFESFQVTLTGILPTGEPFRVTSTFLLRGPGLARIFTLWPIEAIGLQIVGTDTYVGPIGPGGNVGLKLQCDLQLPISDGRLMALSLGKVKVGYIEAGAEEPKWVVNTGETYWWDGQDYPYGNITSPVTAGQTASVTFFDNPGVYVTQNAKEKGIAYHFIGAWKTYFVYQDNSPGAVPVILDSPFSWQVQFDVSWDKTNWNITNKKFQNPLEYKNFNLPDWSKNLVPTPVPLERADATLPTPRLLKAGLAQASRSVDVTFQNYTNAYMALLTAHLDHGIWTENKYPPDQIGAGTGSSPVSVSWASESQGFMTGTEGYVIYILQDMETKMKVYWDNPFGGGNGYSITLDGPLASIYKAEYSGGDGNNANITYTLKEAS